MTNILVKLVYSQRNYVFISLRFMKNTISRDASLSPQALAVKVAYVSSYLPRRCGIATFTNDLVHSVNKINQPGSYQIIAMTDSEKSYDYSDKVKFEIHQYSKTDYEQAAKYINSSSVNVVSLQHEFGLHTGPSSGLTCCLSAGAEVPFSDEVDMEEEHYLLSMLDNLTKPVVTTFHTIIPSPNNQQMYIVRRIIKQSAAVVAMSEISRKVLIDVYGCPAHKAVLIFHGIPDFEFGKTKKYREKLNIKDSNPMILTAGLLGPGKGLEVVIKAMPAVVKKFPLAKLFIVGQTHPVILENEGETYRNKLLKLVEKNNLAKNVEFVNRYLSDEDLQAYFQASDFFVTAYTRLQQSTSGMLVWGLGSGNTCISTPYQHAEELLSDGSGVIVEQNSPSFIAKNIIYLCNNPEEAQHIRKLAYSKGHKAIWANVGKKYFNLFKKILKEEKTQN